MEISKMYSNDTYIVQITLKNGETLQFFGGYKLNTSVELLNDFINDSCYNIKSANIIVTTTTIMNAYSKED